MMSKERRIKWVFLVLVALLWAWSGQVRSVPPEEYEAKALSQNWSYGEHYMVHFEVEGDPNHEATSVEITGPGIEGYLSLDYNDSSKTWNSWHTGKSLDFGNSPPEPPLTYTFTIVDPLTTTVKIAAVESFVSVYATDLSPSGGEVVTDPLAFSWTGVGPGYTYTVALMDSPGPGPSIWDSNEGLTTTSASYDGPALTSGTEYFYCIVVMDVYGNESTAEETFVYQATSPLVGTWGFQELCHWNDGRWDTSSNRMTFSSDGTGILIYERNENGSLDSGVENFTYTIESNPDGTITVWYTAEGDTEPEPHRVVLSADEKVILVDGTIDPNKQDSSVLVRIDTTKTYGNADLSGEYYTIYYDYSLEEEEEDYDYGGNSGIMTFDGSGNIPSVTETLNRDGTISTESWGLDTYDVNADGSFVWSDMAGMGYLTGNGKVWILPSSESTDYWGNYTAIKKGDKTYSTADLEGTWAVASFGDEDGNSFNAKFGYAICDANGNYSYNCTNQRDGTFTTETSTGTFSVLPDGSFGESITPGAPYYAGAIGNDGNIIIFNMSSCSLVQV
ncbi:MAG: hypothetical protein ACYTBZ_30465 [Planctomycetota bacterium]|jgi:hypothetical protein